MNETPERKPATLVDLAEMLNQLVEQVDLIDAQTYSDTLEGCEGAFEVKAEKVVYAIRGIEHRAALMREQAKLFQGRIAAVEENAGYLRTYLLHALEFTGKVALETPAFTMRLKRTTSVNITNEAEVPSQLMRVKETEAPDKIAIGKQLKAGEEVPGCELEHRTSLTITGGKHGEP